MRRVPPLAILALGWVLVLAYAYPGVMTYDSVEQLREGRLGVFSDGHPPVMAALWGLVDRVCPGPFGMLAVQTSAFLGGLYLVLRRALAPRTAAIAAVLVLLYPPVLAPMAVIWKDAIMAGMLVLGAGLLLHDRRALGLVALCLATAVRYNALAATLPLVVLLLSWPRRRYLVAAVAWLGITVLAFAANRALVDESKHYWYSTIAIADIAGTIAHAGELSDAELRPVLAGTQVLVESDLQAQIRARYTPDDYEPMIHGAHPLFDVPLYRGDTPMPAARRDAIGNAWRTLVRAHPGAYLAHRLEMFGDVLGLGAHANANLVVAHRAQDRARLAALGLEVTHAGFQDRLERRLDQLARRTPLFHPVVYLAVALLLLGLARHRDVLALLLSGLALEASLVPAAPTTDYRYSHWLVVTTCLAVVLLVRRRYGSSSSSPKITPERSSTASNGSARMVSPVENDVTSK